MPFCKKCDIEYHLTHNPEDNRCYKCNESPCLEDNMDDNAQKQSNLEIKI